MYIKFSKATVSIKKKIYKNFSYFSPLLSHLKLQGARHGCGGGTVERGLMWRPLREPRQQPQHLLHRPLHPPPHRLGGHLGQLRLLRVLVGHPHHHRQCCRLDQCRGDELLNVNNIVIYVLCLCFMHFGKDEVTCKRGFILCIPHKLLQESHFEIVNL